MMVKRTGLGKGQGKGYKNILVQDPLIHRLSVKGIKTKIPLYEASPERLKREAEKFKKKEKELLDRYATYKSAEKSRIYRWIRLRQLEKRNKFLIALIDKKKTQVTHRYYDKMQGYKEQIILKNKYGKRVIDITPSDRQVEIEKKNPDDTDTLTNYAQTHRFVGVKGRELWKNIIDDFKKEKQVTEREIAYIKAMEKQSKYKIKKDDKGKKVTFIQAVTMTPIGRLFEGRI